MFNHLPLPLFLVGLTTLYIGERTLGGAARSVATVLAGVCILAALALALWRYTNTQAERRRAYGWVVLGYVTVVAAIGLYGLQLAETLGTTGKAPVLLQVAWPALAFLGLLPTVAMELAISGMVRTPTLEIWRVQLASRAARIVALAVVAFAGVNFTANTWNRKIDLSYFKTTQVGTSTEAIARNLTQPVKFVLFFPPGNEVLEQTRGYVDTLAKASSQISVEVVDQALDPERARELKVRQNGYMAIQCGTSSETLRLDLDAEDARTTLRKLDTEVQQRLLKVIKPARVAYLTTGHMERDYAPPAGDKRPSLVDFKSILESQGFTVRRLGLAEGLGREIPKDASVVCVMGPLEAFSDAERSALQRYLTAGGRALLALDPDHGVTEDALLAPLGVRVGKSLVANPRYLVRVEGQGESPYNVVTTRASTHPVAATLEQNPGRMGIVFLGVGNVSKTEPAPPGVNISFAVHSMPESWEDLNGNGKFDAGQETRGSYEFVAAVEHTLRQPQGERGQAAADPNAAASQSERPMRAVVVGDADFAANGVVRNSGNAYFIVDSMRWLAGDEQNAGTIESEADVPLVHRKDEDAMWFYGTSFLFPAVVLIGGLTYTRRTTRPRRKR